MATRGWDSSRSPVGQPVRTQVTGRSTLGELGPEGVRSLRLLQLLCFFPTMGSVHEVGMGRDGGSRASSGPDLFFPAGWQSGAARKASTAAAPRTPPTGGEL